MQRLSYLISETSQPANKLKYRYLGFGIIPREHGTGTVRPCLF